jgi:uncharacterized protein
MKEGVPMTFDLTLSEGKYLVKLARKTIEANFSRKHVDTSDAPPKMQEVCGVFVTLNTLVGGKKELRGCIGYPYPLKPLVEAIVEVAEAAAFEDPRFLQLKKDELGKIVVEVSVLTPPEVIKVEKPEGYPMIIRVGDHGLIIKRGGRSGLLLPQVATEWGWDSEEFLSQCCIKAGLSPDSWLLPGTEVYSFAAIIFAETTPGGEVEREGIHG